MEGNKEINGTTGPVSLESRRPLSRLHDDQERPDSCRGSNDDSKAATSVLGFQGERSRHKESLTSCDSHSSLDKVSISQPTVFTRLSLHTTRTTSTDIPTKVRYPMYLH